MGGAAMPSVFGLEIGDPKMSLIARRLMQANGKNSIDNRDNKGITGLAYAVGANRTAVVKQLLADGASVNEVDTSGGTALHYAAAYGRKELTEFLLTAGCQVNAKNTMGQTPMALAVKNKQTATADFLKSKKGEV